MPHRPTALDARMRMALVICLCFLFASSAWLSWYYRLVTLVPIDKIEYLTIVLGYLVQALGTGGYLWAMRSRQRDTDGRIILASLALSLVLLGPATLTQGLALTLVFGYLSNALFGVMQGAYLTLLCTRVASTHRGLVFGSAYAASTVCSWLLTLPGNGLLTQGIACVGCCLAIGAATWAIICLSTADRPPAAEPDRERQGTAARKRHALLVACLAVIMASAVRTLGFVFPSTDLASGVSIELSRLFYGLGLVGVGLAYDRDRSLGLAICVVSLAMPFLMMSLAGAGAHAMPLWALAYLFAGIYVLFCVMLFVDLAERSGRAQLAGAGMCLRRIGDVLGTTLSLALAGSPMALVSVSTVLFIVAMGLFFRLWQLLFVPVAEVAVVEEAVLAAVDETTGPTPRAASEAVIQPPADEQRARFERFAAACQLTARERDILRLVLAEKTNAEIAGELVVSERTVKFHMTNLLRKTGCKTRLEILAAYATER